MAAEPDELIIGRIARAHGLSGAVKVELLTDFPERFRDLKTVILQPSQGPPQARGVLGAEVLPEGVILRLEGCADRSQADALRGAYLKIKRADAVALPPGHYYIGDIVGLEVDTPAGVSLSPSSRASSPSASGTPPRGRRGASTGIVTKGSSSRSSRRVRSPSGSRARSRESCARARSRSRGRGSPTASATPT